MVEMFVPAIETVTLLLASMLNGPPSSARIPVTPAPLTVPEIDAPPLADDGPTGDNDAFPPHAAMTAAVIESAKIVTCDRTTFMNFLHAGNAVP
jgi:hypothetical protein